MRNNFVYRNYLLPEFPKIAHQLRTYLQSLDKYRDYSLEEINLVIKNTKEDRSMFRKLRKQMKAYNDEIQVLRRKYFERYLLPIQRYRTYEQSIYEVAKAQSIEKKTGLDRNSTEFIKIIYQQSKLVHPSLRKLIITKIEENNQRICKRKQCLRNRFIFPLAYYSPKELYQAEEAIPNAQKLSLYILHHQFSAKGIRSHLYKSSNNPQLNHNQKLKSENDSFKLEQKRADWEQISQSSKLKYEQKFKSLFDKYNSQIDMVCLKNEVERGKLLRMASNQYSMGLKIEQQFREIREEIKRERAIMKEETEEDKEGNQQNGGQEKDENDERESGEKSGFYSSNNQFREEIEQNFTDDQ